MIFFQKWFSFHCNYVYDVYYIESTLLLLGKSKKKKMKVEKKKKIRNQNQNKGSSRNKTFSFLSTTLFIKLTTLRWKTSSRKHII